MRARGARDRTVIVVDASEELSRQLWTMRELLEQLVFKLDLQGLVLSANRARWMPFIAAEIEAIIDAIVEVEQSRSAASARLAAQRRLPAGTSLADLAGQLGPPWGTVLDQHRLHLLSLQGEIEELARSNHELARRGVFHTREVLAALGETGVDVYDPHGLSTPLVASSLRLDRTG